jgi:hypothetical protein
MPRSGPWGFRSTAPRRALCRVARSQRRVGEAATDGLRSWFVPPARCDHWPSANRRVRRRPGTRRARHGWLGALRTVPEPWRHRPAFPRGRPNTLAVGSNGGRRRRVALQHDSPLARGRAELKESDQPCGRVRIVEVEDRRDGHVDDEDRARPRGVVSSRGSTLPPREQQRSSHGRPPEVLTQRVARGSLRPRC